MYIQVRGADYSACDLGNINNHGAQTISLSRKNGLMSTGYLNRHGTIYYNPNDGSVEYSTSEFIPYKSGDINATYLADQAYSVITIYFYDSNKNPLGYIEDIIPYRKNNNNPIGTNYNFEIPESAIKSVSENVKFIRVCSNKKNTVSTLTMNF